MMITSFEQLQKFGNANIEATLKSLDAYSKNAQAITQEVVDYSKRSLDEGSRAAERLLGAKSLDSALDIQSAYVKGAYEGFISQATKLGSLYAELARETYKPFESQVAQAAAK